MTKTYILIRVFIAIQFVPQAFRKHHNEIIILSIVKYNYKENDSGCTSDLIIYGCNCNLCINKPYVGKTTNMLADRKSEHKYDFGKIIEKGISNINLE